MEEDKQNALNKSIDLFSKRKIQIVENLIPTKIWRRRHLQQLVCMYLWTSGLTIKLSFLDLRVSKQTKQEFCVMCLNNAIISGRFDAAGPHLNSVCFWQILLLPHFTCWLTCECLAKLVYSALECHGGSWLCNCIRIQSCTQCFNPGAVNSNSK